MHTILHFLGLRTLDSILGSFEKTLKHLEQHEQRKLADVAAWAEAEATAHERGRAALAEVQKTQIVAANLKTLLARAP